MENPYTYIDDELAPVWQCNDCGAYAAKKEEILHFSSCKPGDSQRWQEIYEAANKEEEEFELEFGCDPEGAEKGPGGAIHLGNNELPLEEDNLAQTLIRIDELMRVPGGKKDD